MWLDACASGGQHSLKSQHQTFSWLGASGLKVLPSLASVGMWLACVSPKDLCDFPYDNTERQRALRSRAQGRVTGLRKSSQAWVSSHKTEFIQREATHRHRPSSAFTVICLTGLLRRVAEPGMFGLPGSCSDLDIHANISGVLIDTTMGIGEAALEMPAITGTAQMPMIQSQ